MDKGCNFSSTMVIWVFLHSAILLLFAKFGAGEQARNDHGPPVRFPFRLKQDQQNNSGYPDPAFELSCHDKNQKVLELNNSVKLLVDKIDYTSQTIKVSDLDGCLARKLLQLHLLASPFRFVHPDPDSASNLLYDMRDSSDQALYKCGDTETYMEFNFQEVPCLNGLGYKVYCIPLFTSISELPLTNCTKIGEIRSVPWEIIPKQSAVLRWSEPDCHKCEARHGICSLKNYTRDSKTVCLPEQKPRIGEPEKLEIAGSIGSFLLVLAAIGIYHIYSVNKIEKESQMKIERFLEDYRAMRPARYSYSDIKRITNQFKDKLGQGGYGSVYKGMLSKEVFVAIKVLNNSTDNGEDFINEVETIGRIHHVNVVRLVGFCADGSARALVYEYLPNDSLEKFIFSENSKSPSLGWEKLQDIALGVARGIEYLHQGCEKRILHFDIKPHNVLLDQNFNPKISDFGLAKLCPKEQSVVSMTAARGTLGYIAPEILSRNFGKASYKSDVYSYGMLLLEMVGGRKNIDVRAENTGQIYFPEWIYHHLDQQDELQIRIEEEKDAGIVKKLTTVGLWCIQWNPVDRPSMQVVIQMLEGDAENLSLPPNPFSTTNGTRTGICPIEGLTIISEQE
ncbi:Glycerophosphodiester phosphodiesterase [Bertholletia excelsa]